jgi:hypothetical protein
MLLRLCLVFGNQSGSLIHQLDRRPWLIVERSHSIVVLFKPQTLQKSAFNTGYMSRQKEEGNLLHIHHTTGIIMQACLTPVSASPMFEAEKSWSSGLHRVLKLSSR